MKDFAWIESHHRHVWFVSRRAALRGLAALGIGLPLALGSRRLTAQASECATSAVVPVEGPYFFDEPEPRTRTGSGLIIRGVVRDADTCEPIAGARILRWHSNQTGIYEDYYRALMITSTSGEYEMETIVPGIYAGLARHVHFQVVAGGYEELITQVQWSNGSLPPRDNEFHFVLRRAV